MFKFTIGCCGGRRGWWSGPGRLCSTSRSSPTARPVNTLSAGGVTATVTVESNGDVDQAVAFDTALSGTADPDLEAPFGGTGPTDPGKVLIISEDGGPDDERFGGKITFAFDQLVSLMSFDAFDGARYEVTALSGDVFLG